jgi:hypothetical protein
MLIKLLKNQHFLVASALLAILGIVCLVGIIIAIVRWKRHRAASAITIGSLLLTIASAAILMISRFYVNETRTEAILQNDVRYRDGMEKYMDLAVTQYQTFNLFFLIGGVVETLLIIFFLVAIFTGRPKKPPEPFR